jgi:hypothetical protein
MINFILFFKLIILRFKFIISMLSIIYKYVIDYFPMDLNSSV